MHRPIALTFCGIVLAIVTTNPLAGADAPTGRYTIANDAALDTETGLQWSQLEQPGGPFTWVDAQTQCPTPWRVPTVQELRTLSDLTQTTPPAIDTSAFFGETAGSAPSAGLVWTSTPYLLDNSGYAYSVSFTDGSVNPVDPTQQGAVRCVQ
jgi:Protein of unknown function (DUF1566)